MKFSKIFITLASLLILFTPIFGNSNVQAVKLKTGSFPFIPETHDDHIRLTEPILNNREYIIGNIHFKNTGLTLNNTKKITIKNGGTYIDGNLRLSGKSEFKSNGETYVKGATSVRDNGTIQINKGKEHHFNKEVTLESNNALTIKEGYAFFYNTVELNNSSGTTINGGAVFSSGLSLAGSSSATINNDVTIEKGNTSVTGNSTLTINGDLYVGEQATFNYENAGKICVDGMLYYDGDTPPAHFLGSCSEATAPGLYVKHVVDKNKVYEASLDYEVNPTAETFYITPETGVATAEFNTAIIPQGEIDETVRLKPMDLIFMIDSSSSMKRGLITELLGRLFGIDSQLELAIQSVKESINILEDNLTDGDRFGVITFDDNPTIEVNFNEKNEQVADVKSHLSNMNTKMDAIKTAIKRKSRNWHDDTNYDNALQKAHEMFGNSDNTKYIIVLTDGRAQDITNDTVVRDLDGFYEPQVCIFCKKTYIKQDNVTITNNLLGHRSEFEYNGKKYKYSKKFNVSDLKTIDQAQELSADNIKVFSIEIRSKNNDAEFLSDMATITGGQSFKTNEEKQLLDTMKHIISLTEQTSMTEIQLKINLEDVDKPEDSNIAIPDESDAFKSEDEKYLIVSIPDIEYTARAGTPANHNYLFTMEFDKQGTYTFNDVQLTYTDLAGTKQTVKAGPLAIEVESYNLQFKNASYGIDVYSNNGLAFNEEGLKVMDIELLSGNQLSLKDEIEVLPPPDVDPEEFKLPENIIYEWSTDDINVATVNNEGIATAKGVGTTLISVQLKDEEGNNIVNEPAKALVKVNLKGIKFNSASYEFDDGKLMYADDVLLKDPVGFNTKPSMFEAEYSEKGLFEVDAGGALQRSIEGKCGFAILTVKLKDEYKFDENEKVEAETLIKVNADGKDGYNVENEW